MALHSSNQKLEVNAYAERLIREATESLDAIVAGQILLEGATVENEQAVTAPLINNLDPESNVEAFYDRIVMPPRVPAVYVSPVQDWESFG